MLSLECVERYLHLPDELDELSLLSPGLGEEFVLDFLCVLLSLFGVPGRWKSGHLLLLLAELDVDLEELDLLLANVSTGALLALCCGSGHIALVHHAIFVVTVDCPLQLF